jgi:hypothetical protein
MGTAKHQAFDARSFAVGGVPDPHHTPSGSITLKRRCSGEFFDQDAARSQAIATNFLSLSLTGDLSIGEVSGFRIRSDPEAFEKFFFPSLLLVVNGLC